MYKPCPFDEAAERILLAHNPNLLWPGSLGHRVYRRLKAESVRRYKQHQQAIDQQTIKEGLKKL